LLIPFKKSDTLLQQTTGKIQGIAPGNDFRALAGISGGDGKIDNTAGTPCGQERNFGFKLEVMPARKPGTQPRAADEPETALAIVNASTAKQRGHGVIGPTTQGRHMRRIGQTIADHKIGTVTQIPKAFKIGGMMLAVAVEKEEPFDGIGQGSERVPQGGGLAVMGSARGENLSSGF